MRHDDRLVGVITLSKLGLRRFDDDDLRLLLDPGRPGRHRVRRAPRHLAETRRLAAELRQLLDMSSALSRSLDPKDVARPDGGAPGAGRGRGAGADQRLGPRPATGCAPWAATRASTASAIDDFYSLADYPLTAAGPRRTASSRSWTSTTRTPTRPRSALLRREGMRGLIMLPLVAKGAGDRARGARPSSGRPTDDPAQITLARTMAHEAAMALENARAVRDGAQPCRPRPADRLLQPPVPARAPVRGGRPRRSARAGR